jgi:hypothetical protein
MISYCSNPPCRGQQGTLKTSFETRVQNLLRGLDTSQSASLSVEFLAWPRFRCHDYPFIRPPRRAASSFRCLGRVPAFILQQFSGEGYCQRQPSTHRTAALTAPPAACVRVFVTQSAWASAVGSLVTMTCFLTNLLRTYLTRHG